MSPDDPPRDVHETIRSTAVGLFETYGYPATTVEQIARAARVGPVTVYRHFGSKDGILLQVPVDEGLQHLLDRLADHEAEPVSTWVVDALREHLGRRGDAWLREAARQFRLVATTPELTSAMWQRSTTWTDTLHRRLGPGLTTRVRARTVVSAVVEAVLDWAEHAETPSTEALVERLERAFAGIG